MRCGSSVGWAFAVAVAVIGCRHNDTAPGPATGVGGAGGATADAGGSDAGGTDAGLAPADADTDASAPLDQRAEAGGGGGGQGGAGTGGAGGTGGAPPDVPGCVAAISVGSSHACARRTDGTLWCWGSNTNGEIGIGTPFTASILAPTQVTALGVRVIQAAVGTGFFSCATTDDGSAWCWGTNTYGQLGNGDRAEQRAPAQVQAPGGAYAAVAPGNVSTCARTADGKAWCWGLGPTGRDASTTVA